MPAQKTRGKQSHQSLFGEDTSRPSPGGGFSQRGTSENEMVTAHVDGGARGNPGPAGYGVYLADAQGKMLAELSEFLGIQTNNYAEYNGLLAALDFAVKHGHA